ncbi:SRSF7 factor, partial [Eubucco bourcierii]|nr:SRSF7 factor [Eubucco bourcierii]
ETKVYVGNLGTGAGKGELERAFSYYGPLRTVWIARNPPGFAFVEFEDPRDAEDAVLGLDGKIICGSRVRVEVSTGMPRRSRYDRPPARRPFDPNDRCYECGEKGHYAYDCHRYSRRRRSRYVRGRRGRLASPGRSSCRSR